MKRFLVKADEYLTANTWPTLNSVEVINQVMPIIYEILNKFWINVGKKYTNMDTLQIIIMLMIGRK